ncbi:MAG: class I SAM-dependent methyltransferase [Desulfuromonadales bacterium]|nr:class I SAM-dependent methyltransferase [Desulfuromonadales bacterium]
MDVRQISNQRKYDLAASSYDFIAYLMSLGQAKRLYDELADCFNLPPGATIVELGCGPASVIPSLLKKIPSKTTVIGIDFSEQMIAIANRKKEHYHWDDVHFECMDMYEFAPEKELDAVVFCLALTAIPDSIKALKKAISILKPGGQLLILDSIPLNSRWYHPFANIYMYAKSMIVGAKPNKSILDYITNNLVNVAIKERVFGVYTLISAFKPN